MQKVHFSMTPFSRHADIRIQLLLQWFIPAVGEPVEIANFVRTVNGTSTGADTTIIDLRIQSILIVISREYGTGCFTWRIVALLT